MAGLMLTGLPAWSQDATSAPTTTQQNPETTPYSIILFDQSGSMGRFDSLAVSTIWMKTLARTFDAPRDVLLVGFDSRVHPPITFKIGPDIDMAKLGERLSAIKRDGKTTDFEAPLRYLSTANTVENAELVLLISDGKPEIWDPKLSHMSREVLGDSRYEALNAQVMTLRTAQNSSADIWQQLGPQFQKRNLDLIDERIKELGDKLANKTVIWDLSAESEHLKTWAVQLNSEYIPINIADEEQSISQLLFAVMTLQQKTSALMETPLQEGEQQRYETVLSVVQDTVPELNLQDQPPAPPVLPPHTPKHQTPPMHAKPVVKDAPIALEAMAQTVSPIREKAHISVPQQAPTLPRRTMFFIAFGVFALSAFFIVASVSWQLRRMQL
ncbi:vWA domain-containing protein [Magnetovibrio sp. PR-2]|uniref:vWA domain-containing protein n=1 Tax=Magnetovibrio sp. PR-2 TaxID=3120356 RepID=UPI002FCDFEBB